MHVENLNLNNPSFFDNPDDLPFGFYVPNPSHAPALATSPILTDHAICRNPHANFNEKGMFGLHQHLLVLYQSPQSKTPKLVLNLTFARLFRINNPTSSKGWGFIFVKNGVTLEFVLPFPQIVGVWANALSRVCVMTDFENDFVKVRKLGEGSFAKVYSYKSQMDEQKFAVKEFDKARIQNSSSTTHKDLLINELAITRTLDHDNVVKSYKIYESATTVFLVLEYIKGRTYQYYLRQCTELQKIQTFESLMKALAYLGSKGIAHRDIKPENLMIDEDGNLKIIDFGLACDVTEKKFIITRCGSAGYIAPEVYNSKEEALFGTNCDVFSAGCILYHILFGERLFRDATLSKIMKNNRRYYDEKKVQAVEKAIKDQFGKICKKGLDLLVKMLEVDPAKRISCEKALRHPFFAALKVSGITEADKRTSLELGLFHRMKCQEFPEEVNGGKEEIEESEEESEWDVSSLTVSTHSDDLSNIENQMKNYHEKRIPMHFLSIKKKKRSVFRTSKLGFVQVTINSNGGFNEIGEEDSHVKGLIEVLNESTKKMGAVAMTWSSKLKVDSDCVM